MSKQHHRSLDHLACACVYAFCVVYVCIYGYGVHVTCSLHSMSALRGVVCVCRCMHVTDMWCMHVTEMSASNRMCILCIAHMHSRAHTHAHARTNTHRQTHTHTPTRTHTHTYIHTYAIAHIHTCAFSQTINTHPSTCPGGFKLLHLHAHVLLTCRCRQFLCAHVILRTRQHGAKIRFPAKFHFQLHVEIPVCAPICA